MAALDSRHMQAALVWLLKVTVDLGDNCRRQTVAITLICQLVVLDDRLQWQPKVVATACGCWPRQTFEALVYGQ
jgi:hypothetical protein